MMKGEWVILLWALLGAVFLVKTTPVSGLVRKVRRQPSAVQAAVALCLLVAVITGGTKPGGTNELSSSSQPAFFAPENASLIIQQSSLISGGWPYDPTDTDGDGIPDLWEKWTHGNRQVADGGIDRDEDGLTDLEEFQSQTDPRTADTDADGFDDAFEVVNGMDPLVQEDFTPVEPDENQNGFIDLWENEPYLYGFTDTNHNGFDDYYEAYYLEPESEDNYDVVVDVCTTRSAALTWTVGALTEGVVLPATTMTSVRIRLPFKSDAKIELLAAPLEDTLPAGELWKARLRLSFAPRDGQTAIGTCLVSDDGDIQQKVPESVSAVVRFPVGAPMSPASTSSGGEGLVIDILERRFEIIPPLAVYYWVGDDVGPFTVTNAVNIDPSAIQWSADFGTMSPSTGGSSTLTVTSVPPDEGNIVVTAEIMLDEVFRAVDTAVVSFCPGKDLSITDYTPNFSPQLFETNWVSVTVPGCGHIQNPGWLEIEVVREVIGEVQHVASLDMDPQTPAIDRFLDTSLLGGQSLSFAWDGRAQVTLPLADHPDLFTQGHTPFHRAMPEIRDGDPVPPPFYTVAARLWNSEKTEVLNESSRKVFIPQVVAIYWQPEAIAKFRTPIAYPFADGDSTTVYPGYGGSRSELFQDLVNYARQFMPSDVNLRFTVALMEEPGVRSYYVKRVVVKPDEVSEIDANNIKVFKLGEAGVIPRNERDGLQIDCFAGSFVGSWENSYENFAENLSKSQVLYYQELFDIPNSPDTLLLAMGCAIAHETGHAVGLVHGSYMEHGPEYHNPEGNPDLMMDRTTKPFLRLRDLPPTWKELNRDYLRFILPTH